MEFDSRAAEAIRELAAEVSGRLCVIEADALTVNLPSVTDAPRQIIANLPYNAATPMLIAWLRQAAAFERMTLMFQQEVAERICAGPGTATYGRLSVLAQATCSVDLAMRLPPSAFVPPPKVWSAVISIIPHADQPTPGLLRVLERITAAAFGQRRKMLRSSLRQFGGEVWLHAQGIAPDRRAETLSVTEFLRLAEALD